ncbi:MAG: ABC transporter ATP-binding protein [Nitrospinota bacterium]
MVDSRPEDVPAPVARTLLEMRGVTKHFGPVVANDGVDFEVQGGEVHALLGENGAGKTTLMNVLYGLYAPDAGRIFLRGEEAAIRGPRDAMRRGIGMIHQHFMLVPTLTVVENSILGMPSPREPFLSLKEAAAKIGELAERYRLRVDPLARVAELSVGEQQRVEILKALYRKADLFILDEPTAVLTPQETQHLMPMFRALCEEGRSVIFITHKLEEVRAFSDRVTVLRDGKRIATLRTAETENRQLAALMVGREVFLDLEKREPRPGKGRLQVEGLCALGREGLPALRNVSFQLHEGEILGVAGVDGNGQEELAEVLTGLRRAASGAVRVGRKDVTNCPTRTLIRAGVAHIPSDRRRRGLVMGATLEENAILESFDWPPFSSAGVLKSAAVRAHARELVEAYDIRASSTDQPVRHLSGGNQQKVILGRALHRNPGVLIAAQPTRGLDIGATEYVRKKLLELREAGAAILLISIELDEVLALSDRIAVMYEGEIVAVVNAAEASAEELGLWMAGARPRSAG